MTRKFKNKNIPKGILIDRGYVWIRIFPNGREFNRCFGPVTKPSIVDDAIRKLNHYREQIRLGKFNLEEKVIRLTIEEAVDTFLKLHASKAKVPKNFRSLFQSMLRFFAGRYMDTFTYIDVDNFRKWRENQVKASTVNREHAVLTTLFYRLKEWRALKLIANVKLPEDNPGRFVKKVDERQFIRKRVLSPDEFRQFMSVAPLSVRRICLAALNSTLRLKDLKMLTKEHINAAAGLFQGIQEKPGVPYNVSINRVMRELIDSAPGRKIFDFTNFRKYFESAREEAKKRYGLPHFEFKDLRRTAARAIWDETKDLLLCKEALGHTDAKTTQWYLGITNADIQRAGRVLESKFMYNVFDPNCTKNYTKENNKEHKESLVSSLN